MKKTLTLFLVVSLLLAGSAAAEDIDLSGLSFDQLVALRDRLNLAIWNCQEWQEVTVPAGIWIIGEDIPAGHWSIRPMDGSIAYLIICRELDKSGRSYKRGSALVNNTLVSESHRQHNDSFNSIDFDLVDGMYVINDSAVIFSTYSGKPDLGFH